MFWEKPKEVQFQQPEAVLSICHRGCPAINEKKFKVRKLLDNPKNGAVKLKVELGSRSSNADHLNLFIS